MSTIDYTAPSRVWIIPKNGIVGQSTARQELKLSEAIKVLLGLPLDQQKLAYVEVLHKTPPQHITRADALEIFQRPDFPKD